MAKEQVAGQEALGTAMNKTEFFFEKNGKLMSYIFLGLLILAALILCAAAAILLYNRGRAPAAAAQITSGSRIVAQLDLSQDQELDVEGPQGGRNHLIIKDGEIWCSQADCPDKLCVKQGKKSLDGDTIVCLPNQMAVTILAP